MERPINRLYYKQLTNPLEKNRKREEESQTADRSESETRGPLGFISEKMLKRCFNAWNI